MPQERIIKEELRPNGEKLVTAISEYKGVQYVSVRVYYQDRTTDEFKPGRNGINLPVAEAAMLFDAVDALKAERLVEAATEYDDD